MLDPAADKTRPRDVTGPSTSRTRITNKFARFDSLFLMELFTIANLLSMQHTDGSLPGSSWTRTSWARVDLMPTLAGFRSRFSKIEDQVYSVQINMAY